MVTLTGNDLTIEDIFNVSVNYEKVGISSDALEKISKSRKNLEKLLEGDKPIYGVNTGFGSLLNVSIPKDKISELQENLIRSHSSGVGEPLSSIHVRAMMLVRANNLCKGFSGVRPELVNMIIEMLNGRIHPIVPRYGSVGASGDLAPLAHVALTLMGEGRVELDGTIMDSADALQKRGLSPLSFTEKEGVAFINGTAAISGILAVELEKAFNLMRNAILSSSMAFEGLKGTLKAFREWAVGARPHRGQITVAENFRKLLSDSRIVEISTKEKVQDPYSLRCIPQVYGAVLDTLNYAKSVLHTEINSATDNPLIIEGDYASAGNFHGEPVALVSDFVAIALTDLGNIVERRVARLTDASLSGLPPFLVEESGYNSGYMIPQYTAAALCNRNKVLAYPSTADSIPTSANQEDHVSMGTNSAIKLMEIVDNLKNIIAIEFLLGAQALEFAENETSENTKAVYNNIRKKIAPLKRDRPPYPDIAELCSMIESGDLLKASVLHIVL